MNNEKPTILIVDDTESNIDILLELLSEEYDIIVATEGSVALEIAREDSIDLILLDIMMPKMDGYEVCRLLKEDEETKDIPVVFITAKIDEDSIEQGYVAGGIDYVTKPFKPRELSARIKTQLNLKFLIERLEFIASYDPLTGIYNRRKFFEVAQKQFDNHKENLFAIMMDIDNFKQINDTYGHPIGDKVINAVAKTVRDFLDSESVFGRLGGEEFSIVCRSRSLEEITDLVESIRKAVGETETLSDENEGIRCSISMGFAKGKYETKNLDALLKEADIALYEAKGSGRNRSIFRD